MSKNKKSQTLSTRVLFIKISAAITEIKHREPFLGDSLHTLRVVYINE